MNPVVELRRDGEIAVLAINSPPVNALSAQVREGIVEGIRAAGADSAVKAVVLHCEGRTFFAGADISEFGKLPKHPMLPEVVDFIEASAKPVVAALHGTALGGGLETALACHYRVAVPSAKCGFPEVKLGLLPGAGGTQRLPRLVGPERAMEMVTSGSPISAKAAKEMGIVDELVDEKDLLASAIAFARKVVAENRPLKKVRDLDDKIAATRGKPEIFEGFRKANARKFRGFQAPEYNIRCIEAAVNLPFDEGIKLERQLFQELVSGEQSAAQRHVFFAERQVWKIPDISDDTPTLPVKKVGIIGAGTMGGGISMNFANAGLPVTIVEAKPEALERGLGVIRRNYESTAKKGRMSMEDVERRMGLLTGSLNMQDLADCDLIIEAVFENMAIKKEIFTKLDAIAKPGAILASNTSYLNVNEIAAMTKRPEHVLGMHFFSPANIMRLLEVVRGEKTDKRVIATAMQLGRQIGKIAVLVGVCHGFVGNRMLEPRQREANRLILEGAMPWDVDRVLYEFGFPMGPFAMADLAGLDIGWSRETSKGETVREILCEQDRRGQKTGAGFYDYDENRNAKPSELVEQIILDLSAKNGITRRKISDQEILERCVYTMINEGAKILEEGIAIRSSDIDIVWINGYGWPVYRGGPMFYGEQVGLGKVFDRLRAYEAQYGANFKPAALLERLVAEGKGFRDL
ncbi:3-hydroxyacyl-CoA dehydrogenase NAD-binding domain-containing protein [Microvirga sp. CF3062]|uniref:3-hydroxyacyl-CoA dehydrogenase NAD-binding domain-containing protein n=1 Tax=Microvirga sp. CF3062 TaxID=3110182 RepID=UPI002E760910|nr:3-hydroxyacyl-CoA dehydrogenase NAD-binding domain-containing protein [Microvirga sp. CF3062]MEE1656052.1 3-hydroxyacyl-CoA dehydrogenase NAD-binding domain-containing protein [Microvirga sp. CF3062]